MKKRKKHVKQKTIKKTVRKTARQRVSSVARTKKGTGTSKLVSKSKKVVSRPGRIAKGNQRFRKTIVASKPGKGSTRKDAAKKQVGKIPFSPENVTTIFDGVRERKDDVTGDLINVPSKVFELDLPKGSFKDKIDYIRNFDFDGLVKKYRLAKEVGKGFLNRSFLVSLHSKFKGKQYDRNKITPPDFESLDGNALKKFVLDRMVSFQDNFLERKDQLEEDEEEMKESDKAFNPDRLSTITIKFIY